MIVFSLTTRSTCPVCTRNALSRVIPPRRIPTQATPSTSSPQRPPRSRRYLRPLSATLLLLPPLFFFFRPSSPPTLSPQIYSDHPCSSTERISPQNALLTIPIPPPSLPLFGNQTRDGTTVGREKGGEVTIHHVMIKSPDLQIERPYTPINDVVADGELKLVVKAVKGGEVGRLVHSLKAGDDVGIRGPIPTLSLLPAAYDKIIMVSTGTGIVPFLQFLSKLPSLSPQKPSPHLHLIHALPKPDREDWVTTSDILPRLERKLGSALTVDRIPPGPIGREVMESALAGSKGQGVMVLVCLPPALFRPLCGPMTATLDQGEVTGVLRDLGLTNQSVWKLD